MDTANTEWIYGPVIVLVLVLGLVMVAYLRLVQKYSQLRKRDNSLRARAEAEAEEALERAKDKSLSIIEESRLKAEQIIAESDFVSHDVRERVSRELDEVAKNEMKNYRAMLDELKNDTVRTIGSVSQGFKGEAEGEINDFRDEMKKQLAQAQEGLKKKMREEYSKIDAEVAGYREQRMKEVEENIGSLVSEVGREVLGRAIDLSEHEELVMRALERAKREGVV